MHHVLVSLRALTKTIAVIEFVQSVMQKVPKNHYASWKQLHFFLAIKKKRL